MRKLLIVLMTLAPATVAADDDIEAGEDFARRWCTGCHIVGPGIRGGTVGPSFEDVARMPGKTRDTLFNWMVSPHPPMPDLEVTPEQSALVATYILSLGK